MPQKQKPVTAIPMGIAQSIQEYRNQSLSVTPKVQFHQGAKKLQEQNLLDDEVDRLASLIASGGIHRARRQAKLRGKNVIVSRSRHYQNYPGEEPSDEESEDDDSDEESEVDDNDEESEDDDKEDEEEEEDGDGNGNGGNGGQEVGENVDMSEKSKVMERIKAKRNMATICVHDQWQFWPGSEEIIKEGSRIVHQLHRDYLRLAFDLGINNPSPISRRLIDKTAPPQFQQKLEQAGLIYNAKMRANSNLTAGTADGASEEEKQKAITRHRQKNLEIEQKRRLLND